MNKRPPSKEVITAHTVEARVFRLVDHNGKERGLFQTSGDRATFTLFSPKKDGPSISLVTGLDENYGYAELIVEDRLAYYVFEMHKPREPRRPLVLGVHPKHDPVLGFSYNQFIRLSGRHLEGQACLTMHGDEAPSLKMLGMDGKQRLRLGTDGGNEPRLSLDSLDSKQTMSVEADKISRLPLDGDTFQRASFDPPIKLGSKEHRGQLEAKRRKPKASRP